jgi:GT2 family glycosyltransferase
MESEPKIAVLTPRIAYRDHPDRLWYGGGEVDWRRASAFTPGFNERADSPEAMRAREVTFASGCALFVRREAMLAIGGFDPRYFMYEEDVEWCLRARSLGYAIRYLPAALVLHRAQGGSKGEEESDRSDFWSTRNPRLPFYAFHVIRNRLLNVYAYANAKQRCIVAAFFPLYILRRAIPFLRGGRVDATLAMFRGAIDSWKHRKPETVQTPDGPFFRET